MMEINEETLSSKAIVIANCPIKSYSEYIVSASSTGTKGNDTFFSLYIFDSAANDPIRLLTKIPTNLVFSSIAWTPLHHDQEDHCLGYVIGGHPDGSVSLWDVNMILSNATQEIKEKNFGCLNVKKLSKDSIGVISVNVRPHLFAIGAKKVSTCSIDQSNYDLKVEISCDVPAEGGDFCSLNWNDKVNHILASATNTGMTYIYDMKKCSIFVSILDQSFLTEDQQQNLPMNTSVVWSADGAQVVIAYDAPDFNYLTQYHMKQPKAPSAMYQNGHSTSILSVVKNSRDPNFLLSLGRDNIVTCWSSKTKKPIYKSQLKEKCSQVLWANKIPDCFIAAGFDGKIYYDRINFTEDLSAYAEGVEVIPNWFIRPAGISFAFGGKLYHYSSKKQNQITVFKIKGNKELIDSIKAFNEMIEKEDLNALFDSRMETSSKDKNGNISLFWAALKSIHSKQLDDLFDKMGYDKEKIDTEILTALGRNKKKVNNNNVKLYTPIEETKEDLDELFEKPVQQVIEPVQQNAQTKQEILEQPNTIQETYSRNINWNVGQEKLVKQSLLIGDLESAVDLLFKSNRASEALLIASIKPELFAKAKETYFNNNKDLYVKSIFPSIINNNFSLLFDFNVIKEWKEYLLYSKTYLGNSEEFIGFADQLGDKLSTNPDIYASLVCYALAEKYDKCIDLLYTNYQREFEKTARDARKMLLHNLFEQMLSVNKVLNPNSRYINENYNKVIYDYCLLLIEEGLNLEASKYLITICNNDPKMIELYERLYYNCEAELSKSFAKPISPYGNFYIRPKLQTQPNQRNRIQMGIGQQKKMYTNPINEPVLPGKPQTFKPPVKEMPKMATPSAPFTTPTPGYTKPTPFMAHPPTVNRMPAKPNTIQTVKPPVETPAFNPQPVVEQPKINFGANRAMPMKAPSFKPINPPMRTIQRPAQPVVKAPMVNKVESNPPKFAPAMRTNEQATPFGNQPVKSDTHSNHSVSMTPDEENIHAYFEKMVSVYNAAYPDENKQRDFKIKIDVLLNKLQLHEIKPNLIKLLLDFMALNDQANIQQLKRLYMRIQSCDWDKNKSWMPLLERIINMKR